MFADLQQYTDDIVTRGGTPALSVAVWHGNVLHRAVSGVLNVDTGVEATVDSVFQIGSVSKAFTASLVMLLVDEGKIDLDRPVRHCLRDFHVLDPRATEAITPRHLLSHTGGLASDPSFSPQDTDEYVNAIARYVDRCFLLPQVHEQLGQRFSYSNAGYVIAGRLVEVVSAVSWRQAVEERIFKPLGMRHALANPAEVLRFRAAIGHLLNGNADAKPSVVSVPYLPMSMAPTGSVLTMSASDLLRFGRAHLSGGKTEMGARWMSQQSAALMRAVHVDLPGPCLMSESRWGLGWALSECQGVKMFGHSGGSGGQQAFLGILPEHDAAFSVQLNGMTTSGSTTVLQQVSEDLLYAIAGARAENPRPVALTGEPSRFTGRFAAAGFRFDVTEQEGQLYVRVEVEGYADLPAKTFRLTPVGENRFTAQGPDGARVYDCIFLDPNANGAPEYLFYGYRLHRRVRP